MEIPKIYEQAVLRLTELGYILYESTGKSKSIWTTGGAV